MSYTHQDVERLVAASESMILPCGCRVTFRGTVENPIADHEPCPAHLQAAIIEPEAHADYLRQNVDGILLQGSKEERLKAFLADVAGKIERGEL